jgi:hypothetical protein
LTTPVFGDCTTLDPYGTNYVTGIALDNVSGHDLEYFYVRVRSTGAPYDGVYHLAAYDDVDCPFDSWP